MTVEAKKTRTTNATKRTKRRNGVSELKTFVDGLELPVKPSVHVNGHQHPTAIVVVDFGMPKDGPVILDNEVSSDLLLLMTNIAREMCRGDTNIRGSVDRNTGVYWAGVPS